MSRRLSYLLKGKYQQSLVLVFPSLASSIEEDRSDPRDGRLNPINSALLIKESCTRSDSNIILRESEKLIQLIHDKQFHLIMIGHPHEFFSFRGFLLSLSSYCLNVSWKIGTKWTFQTFNIIMAIG